MVHQQWLQLPMGKRCACEQEQEDIDRAIRWLRKRGQVVESVIQTCNPNRCCEACAEHTVVKYLRSKAIVLASIKAFLKLMAINNTWDDAMLEREHDPTHGGDQYHKAANAK